MADYLRVRKYDYGGHLPLDVWMRNQRTRIARALSKAESVRVKEPLEHGAKHGDFELEIRDQFGTKTVAYDGMPRMTGTDALRQ